VVALKASTVAAFELIASPGSMKILNDAESLIV